MYEPQCLSSSSLSCDFTDNVSVFGTYQLRVRAELHGETSDWVETKNVSVDEKSKSSNLSSYIFMLILNLLAVEKLVSDSTKVWLGHSRTIKMFFFLFSGPRDKLIIIGRMSLKYHTYSAFKKVFRAHFHETQGLQIFTIPGSHLDRHSSHFGCLK